MAVSTIDSSGLTSPLTSGVTTNTVTSAAATALTLQSAGTTAVTIDTSQNTGFGTTTPTQKVSTTATSSAVGYDIQYGGSYQVASWTVNPPTGEIKFGGTNTTGTYFQTFYTQNTERMRINSSGQLVMATSTYGLNGQLQVGITANTGSMNSLISVAGDQNGGYPIGVRGNSSTQGLIGFFDSSNTAVGSVTKSGSSVAYNTSSDYRLKENIAPMTGALAKVAQLKPVTYTWKVDGKEGQGFIAHELAEVVPDCVTGEKDAVNEDGSIKSQGIDTSKLVATLTSAIQELKAELDELKAKVNA